MASRWHDASCKINYKETYFSQDWFEQTALYYKKDIGLGLGFKLGIPAHHRNSLGDLGRVILSDQLILPSFCCENKMKGNSYMLNSWITVGDTPNKEAIVYFIVIEKHHCLSIIGLIKCNAELLQLSPIPFWPPIDSKEEVRSAIKQQH